jgi:hypothetical protein
VPSQSVSPEVCARPAAVSALGFRGQQGFGLSVLNYAVTSNHIHLLVKDTGGVIPQSMQLIGGRAAHEFNQRDTETVSPKTLREITR